MDVKLFNLFAHYSDQWFHRCMLSLRNKYYVRKSIIRHIWPQIVSIMLVYFVTLTIFPGIESEIFSCAFRSWMPIILMATFNFTDFIGKLMSTLFYRTTGHQLVIVSIIRFLLIPLFALCVAPHSEPFFSNPMWPIFFSILLGRIFSIFTFNPFD